MFDLIPFHKRNRGLLNTEDFFSDFFNSFNNLANNNLSQFKADIKETDKKYVIQAELPGIDKDNIKIDLTNDYLTISASNDEIVEEEKENYIRKERRSGKFQRCFYVKNIKQDEINANYNNGILEIKLPKTIGENNKRRIQIN